MLTNGKLQADIATATAGTVGIATEESNSTRKAFLAQAEALIPLQAWVSKRLILPKVMYFLGNTCSYVLIKVKMN